MPAIRVPSPRPRAAVCAACAAPLTVLQQLRGSSCDSAACRHAQVQSALQQRQADIAARQAQAARAWVEPQVERLPVAWLVSHGQRMVRTSAAARREQRAHLERVAHGQDLSPAQSAQLPAEDDVSAPADAALCTFCKGRCCREGGSHHAFVDHALIQRWLALHPGATAADAAAAYAERLPDRHLQNSCLYHGSQGCTLPREWRADICNRFACNALKQVRQWDAAEPGRAYVAALHDQHVTRAVVLGPAAPRPLPPVRKPRAPRRRWRDRP